MGINFVYLIEYILYINYLKSNKGYIGDINLQKTDFYHIDIAIIC